MAVYAPLKFIEQCEGYFSIPSMPSKEPEVNANAIAWFEKHLESNQATVYNDYMDNRRTFNAELSDERIGFYHNLIRNFGVSTHTSGNMSVDDFLDLAFYYDVRRLWRANKISYIVDNDLYSCLLNMETPKTIPIDCIMKLPSDCFYIDYNGMGGEICKNLVGTFCSFITYNNERLTLLLHLVYSERLNRYLYITNALKLDDILTDKVQPANSNAVVPIDCEDGIIRNVNEGVLFKFLFNFLVYLHASNRDVEISERTRKNHEKPQTEIKNKFREVKEFEVGFVYGKTIRMGQKKVVYTDSADGKTGKGGHKSAHYRSAHWHHFWTGSGDDKKLIIKWVEGVFVNGEAGSEANKVKVHKVK